MKLGRQLDLVDLACHKVHWHLFVRVYATRVHTVGDAATERRLAIHGGGG